MANTRTINKLKKSIVHTVKTKSDDVYRLVRKSDIDIKSKINKDKDKNMNLTKEDKHDIVYGMRSFLIEQIDGAVLSESNRIAAKNFVLHEATYNELLNLTYNSEHDSMMESTVVLEGVAIDSLKQYLAEGIGSAISGGAKKVGSGAMSYLKTLSGHNARIAKGALKDAKKSNIKTKGKAAWRAMQEPNIKNVSGAYRKGGTVAKSNASKIDAKANYKDAKFKKNATRAVTAVPVVLAIHNKHKKEDAEKARLKSELKIKKAKLKLQKQQRKDK